MRRTASSPVASMRRLVRVATEDAACLETVFDPAGTMLSPAEVSVLYWLTRLHHPGVGAIAELGCFVGGTTRVFGEALRRNGVTTPDLHVFDLFEHNDASRRRLHDQPGFSDEDFYDIWLERTREYGDLITLHRGNLIDTAPDAPDPLATLYVDIVKHESLVNPLMNHFVPKLSVGGFLVHQDYFHWQSPWVVYSTELIIDHFDIIGTVSNHMMVLRLRDEIPRETLELDYLAGISTARRIALMRRAINRFDGIRRGLLRVSLLNLAASWPEFDIEAEERAIRTEHAAAARVIRYLDAVVRRTEAGDERPMW